MTLLSEANEMDVTTDDMRRFRYIASSVAFYGETLKRLRVPDDVITPLVVQFQDRLMVSGQTPDVRQMTHAELMKVFASPDSVKS